MSTIQRESIKVIPPTDYDPEQYAKYEWLCPQCGTKTYGDAKRDSLFEIRHDPLCVYCRVKNGEFTLDGGTFKRVKKGSV